MAQYHLGVMYANGEGVPEDDAEAVKWFRMAAEQGYADAQFILGLKYSTGEGVPEDDAEAVKWYRRAARAAGTESAQFELGFKYGDWRGCARRRCRSRSSGYRMAAERGTRPWRNSSWASWYDNGKGVPEDDVRSGDAWFRNG